MLRFNITLLFVNEWQKSFLLCLTQKSEKEGKAKGNQIPSWQALYCTKRVTNEKTPEIERFGIEKDTRDGVLYAPFACVLVVRPSGLEPEPKASEQPKS